MSIKSENQILTLSTYDSTVFMPCGYMATTPAIKFAKILTGLVNQFAEIVGVDGETVTFEIPKTGYFCGELILKAVVPNDWEPLEGMTVHGQYRVTYAPDVLDIINNGPSIFSGCVDVDMYPPTNAHKLFGTIIPE